MENKELNFTGKTYNGFAALFVNLVVLPLLMGCRFYWARITMCFAPSMLVSGSSGFLS